jgi:uncharacterized protein
MIWKNQSKDRMPMLIYGARQVGKTHSVLEFGKEYYKTTVYVNFELEPGLIPYFDGNISPDQVIKVLERYFNKAIVIEESLIVFDEIQLCERALTALKYFAELAPEVHIIGAGSLLGVAINRNKFSFPVGKVYTSHMYPMDFEEFLWAKGKQLLVDQIYDHYEKNIPISDVLHQEALKDYHEYMVTGGMPAVVKTHFSRETILSEKEIKTLILNAYSSDMAKYASMTESVKIRGAFDSIPMQLSKENKKFQYKIIKSGARASLYGDSIDWLIQSGVVLKCTKCEQGFMPPLAFQDLTSFKLYMHDVGLLSEKVGITLKSLSSPELSQYLGALTENYVANGIAANGFELMYWESKGAAEVDFLIVKDGYIIPIEVKSSYNTKSKSLAVYIERYKPEYAIRISPKNFGFENGIKSVPLYAVFAIS